MQPVEAVRRRRIPKVHARAAAAVDDLLGRREEAPRLAAQRQVQRAVAPAVVGRRRVRAEREQRARRARVAVARGPEQGRVAPWHVRRRREEALVGPQAPRVDVRADGAQRGPERLEVVVGDGRGRAALPRRRGRVDPAQGLEPRRPGAPLAAPGALGVEREQRGVDGRGVRARREPRHGAVAQQAQFVGARVADAARVHDQQLAARRAKRHAQRPPRGARRDDDAAGGLAAAAAARARRRAGEGFGGAAQVAEVVQDAAQGTGGGDGKDGDGDGGPDFRRPGLLGRRRVGLVGFLRRAVLTRLGLLRRLRRLLLRSHRRCCEPLGDEAGRNQVAVSSAADRRLQRGLQIVHQHAAKEEHSVLARALWRRGRGPFGGGEWRARGRGAGAAGGGSRRGA